jgi:anti-sigma B factor antagonist
MADRFEATVRSDGQAALIDLAGEIDGQAADAMNQAYELAAEQGADRVVLNFAPTSYINSTGLAVIVELLARARKDRREIHAYGLSDHYRQIFEITRLADFVTLHADEQGAVA